MKNKSLFLYDNNIDIRLKYISQTEPKYDFLFVYTTNEKAAEVFHSEKIYIWKYTIQIQNRSGKPRALLFFVKPNTKYTKNIFPFIPHPINSKNELLSDWGGKKHLINPKGKKLSDVWNHLVKKSDSIVNGINTSKYSNNFLFNYNSKKPKAVLDEVKRVFNTTLDIQPIKFGKEIKRIQPAKSTKKIRSKKSVLLFNENISEFDLPFQTDFIFLDPPYNLSKNYSAWDDSMSENEYIKWSNQWLSKAMNSLSEDGSLFVLNLPKWNYHHIKHLEECGYWMNNWYVWNSTSVPNGGLVPAHYSIVHFSKKSLLNKVSLNERANLNDSQINTKYIFSNIHRIKHNSKRYQHPCNLPFKLIEIFMESYTLKGSTTMDFFLGTGTTGVVAAKLGRQFIGIDIDEKYLAIAKSNIDETIKTGGYPTKKKVKIEPKVTSITKNSFEKFVLNRKNNDFHKAICDFLKKEKITKEILLEVFEGEENLRKSFNSAKRIQQEYKKLKYTKVF